MLESRKQEVTPELMNTLTQLMAQPQSDQESGLSQRLQTLYSMLLRASMEANFNQ